MTEAEWLACGDWTAMLRALPGIDGSRKLRLWCVAWARLILVGAESRHPLSGAGPEAIAAYTREVDASEAFADGQLTRRELHTAKASSGGPHNVFHFSSGLSRLTPDRIIASLWLWVREFSVPTDGQLSALLCDIFGNPFRSAAFDAAWRTSDVMMLATGIYEDRAFDRMPILADALQDAGCTSEDILDHCRDAHAAHVRGCWVVDLVLGKA
jgi:hypothetical protein